MLIEPVSPSSKPEPRVHISYDKEGMKLKGDLSAVALGKPVTVEITGKVTGFSMQEWGCSIDLRPEVMAIAVPEDTDAPTTVQIVKGMRKQKRLAPEGGE